MSQARDENLSACFPHFSKARLTRPLCPNLPCRTFPTPFFTPFSRYFAFRRFKTTKTCPSRVLWGTHIPISGALLWPFRPCPVSNRGWPCHCVVPPGPINSPLQRPRDPVCPLSVLALFCRSCFPRAFQALRAL